MGAWNGPSRARMWLALVGATAVAVGACSGGGASPAPSGAPSAAPTGGASAAPSGAALSGKLRVTFLAYDAKMQPWLDEMKAEFNKLHPDVELTLEIPNLDNYRDSLTTQAQGDSPPDVAQIATSWMPALADAGEFEDWDAVGYSKDLLGKMEATLRDGARYQGKLTGLSYGSSARAVFYNEDVWSKAGATPGPETWDAFIAELKKVKAAGVKAPFYYEGKGQEGMAAWFPYVYFSFGGELERDGKLTIDKDACVQGLTVWDTMNKEGLFEDNVTAGDFTGQRKAMTSGEAGATITGPWLIGMYGEDNPNAKFGTFQIPKGTTEATVGVTDVYVMFKDSKNTDAARAFVEFLMDPDKNLRFIRDRGFLPIYSDQFKLPEFQEGPYKAFTDALPNAKFVPLNPNWVQFDKIGTNAVTAMLLEKSGAEKACQAMIDGLAGLEQ